MSATSETATETATEPPVPPPAPPAPSRARTASRVALGVAVLAASIALAVGWRASAGAIDPVAHAEHLARIRRIETLGHRLNEQILRSRTGLSGSYDPLVRTMRELHQLLDAVHATPAFVALHDHAAVDEALATCVASLAEEDALVEGFKTDDAVLRNGLRYFPTAASEIAEGVEGVAGRETEAAALRALLRDVLRLATGATDDVLSDVEHDLDGLRPAIAFDPRLGVLVRHVEVIAERRRAVDEELAAILASPTSANARALERAYLDVHARAEAARVLAERELTVLVVVGILAIAAAIILLLWASAEELRRTSAQLADAVAAQNRFVSMTSHEFRTPLSVIVSSADLLDSYAEGWPKERRKQHLEKIGRSARGMTDLLDGLLLIGRTDAGHKDFRPAKVDADALALEVVEAQRARARKGVTVELVPSGKRGPVELDARLCKHVLDNLVSNAVKYSRPNGTAKVRVERDERGVRFVVSDDGIGIPSADLGRLFTTFHRAKNVGAVPGTGLGLAIVKRAVEQHGGTIEVASEVDRGTTFDVRLPAPPAAEA